MFTRKESWEHSLVTGHLTALVLLFLVHSLHRQEPQVSLGLEKVDRSHSLALVWCFRAVAFKLECAL